MATSPSLQELLARYGHPLTAEIAEFARLAASAQRQRHKMGVSDTDGITRATGLWALMETDRGVANALVLGGVHASDLAALLKISSTRKTVEVEDALLATAFAAALRDYLESLPQPTEVGPPELALAILKSALKAEPSGRLPDHLKKLGIDYSASFDALESLIAGSSDGFREAMDEQYSRSVRRAADELGPNAAVTPAMIAAAIQRIHPEYGGEKFGGVRLRVSLGPRATVQEWLARVRALYDMSIVARSRHQVIDGELMVLGLATLDSWLAEDLEADGLLGIWRASVAVQPHRASDQTLWASDAPARIDQLGRRFLAQALGTKLRVVEAARDSFIVHIDGAWGSGKSSLFQFLESELERDFLIVKVNAWREQQLGVQWWTLYNALRRAVEAGADSPWRAKLLSRIDVVRTRLFPFVATVVVLCAIVCGLLLVAGLDFENAAKIAESAAKIVSLVAVGFAGVTAAYRFLLPGSRRAAKEYVANSSNPMSEVQRLFARTLERTKRTPAVFLIDDLDRCDEEYVVEFLEVVQTLVRDAPLALHSSGSEKRTKGPYAFIAADGQWIRSSFESHYGSLKMSEVLGRPLGYLFLEKVFQLHVRLPSITEDAQRAFYESLLVPSRTSAVLSEEQQQQITQVSKALQFAETGSEISKAVVGAQQVDDPTQRMALLGAAAVKFCEVDIQKDTSHELARFGHLLEPNPRTIKLFVNTYSTLQTLRILEGIVIPITPLALWTVVEIRWPQLADHLRVQPDDIDQQRLGDVQEPIRTILTNSEVQAAIASPKWGPLTPDQVRECTGRLTMSS